MKDSPSLPGLAVWSSAVMVPFGETEFVCECGAVTDSVTIPEDVFAGIFSLFTHPEFLRKDDAPAYHIIVCRRCFSE